MDFFNQTLINWVFGLLGVLGGAIVNALWTAVKDLQKADKELVDKVAAVEVLVAGDYAKKSELATLTSALFAKLDRIEDKLDRKADKNGNGN